MEKYAFLMLLMSLLVTNLFVFAGCAQAVDESLGVPYLDADTDEEPHASSDADTDSDSDAETDTDTDADTDTDTDADTDADADTEFDDGVKVGRGGWLCDGRDLVFEDEFDSMDWGAWSMKCTTAMVREAECKQENVTAQNGELHIRTRRIGNSNKFTSAGIVSRNGWLTPGRTVCFYAKLPGARGAGNGLWPAIWFMPSRGECWPYGGEIDLLEMVNADGVVHNVYHYIAGHINGVTQPNCGNLDKKREIHVTTGTSHAWFGQYHEYALKMTEDAIIYYLDGKETIRVRKGDQQAHIDTATNWNIQINTAVGGNWPSPVDSSTVNDTYFKIKNIKVVDSSVDRSNVARGKTAHQSSTKFGGVASRAVDGNESGDWGKNSTTHTDGEAEPWWMVDLGREFDIARVSTYNRTDCCGFQLKNYRVEYLDGNQHFIDSINYPGEQGDVAHHVHTVPGVRYVRIKLNGTGVLSLAEVMVFEQE